MTTYYVDPNGGNDASAGTSFATRVASLNTGLSGKIVAGDSVRVIGSPAPTSLGQNATWTYGSQIVTLTSAVTADVTQSTAAWTASANVTTTTSTNRKLGATSASIAVAAAFTTGLAAYFATGTLNLSSYQQVSFWINMTAGSMTADGDITLRLCSDTAGVTTVNTISVPRIRATGQWQAYTVDLGTNLGSSIQSIALYVEQDRAAQTFLINNIIACKASSSVDSLSLTSLISKNTGTEPWFTLQSLTGTAAILEINPQYSLLTNANTGYAGATATQTIYKRDALQIPSASVAATNTGVGWGSLPASGSAGNIITVSGGWDRTAMSSQTLDTYISGVNSFGRGIALNSYITYTNINPFRFYYGTYFGGGSATNGSVTAKDCSCNTYNIYNAGNGGSAGYSPSGYTITIDNVCGAGLNGYFLVSPGSSGNTYTIINLSSNYNSGIRFTPASTPGAVVWGSNSSETFTITNCVKNNAFGTPSAATGFGMFFNGLDNSIFTFGTVKDNGWSQLMFQGIANSKVNISTAVNNLNITVASQGALITLIGSSNNTFDMTGATVDSTNGTAGLGAFNSSAGSTNNIIKNGTYNLISSGYIVSASSGNTVLINPTLSAGAGQYQLIGSNVSVTYSNYGNVTTDQRIYYNSVFGNILTDTTTRHTASGISWKMTSGGATLPSPSSTIPLSLPVATIAVNSSTLVTASIWVYRTSTSLTTNFVCPGGQISGISSDVVATASAAINTWEQLTITFTPTQQGAVQLFVNCYGAAASVYVDDFAVSQA